MQNPLDSKFAKKLKAQAEENPVLAMMAAGGVLTGTAKIINAVSAAQGRRAYAKQVNHSVKKKQLKKNYPY